MSQPPAPGRAAGGRNRPARRRLVPSARCFDNVGTARHGRVFQRRPAAAKVRLRPASELVAGDVIQVEAGDAVPADARLLAAHSLRAQESSLTGESQPVDKTAAPVPADAPLAERANMLFMGTAVAAGRGEAVVTATGMGAELGRVAGLAHGVTVEPTPLQRRIARLGRYLALIVLAIAAPVFVIGVWQGADPKSMFIAALAIGVAAIPEGLPAVMTVTLALGAQRMLGRQALMRRLPAVETLGSVTVICSDKTGTLTQNRMTVQTLDADGDRLNLTGRAAAPSQAHLRLLAVGALCNDASRRVASDRGARVGRGRRLDRPGGPGRRGRPAGPGQRGQ